MAERIHLGDLQGAVNRAVAQVISNRTAGQELMGHGPIVIGFVAPDTLGASDAQKIADEVARSVPNSRSTVVSVGGSEPETLAAWPRIPIIIGLLLGQASNE